MRGNQDLANPSPEVVEMTCSEEQILIDIADSLAAAATVGSVVAKPSKTPTLSRSTGVGPVVGADRVIVHQPVTTDPCVGKAVSMIRAQPAYASCLGEFLLALSENGGGVHT